MTKTGRQDSGEGGSHLQNLIPLLPLIPQGAGRARWQGVGATAKTKGPGFRGAGSVVIPPGFPQERGCTDGFLGAEKERERMALSWCWRLDGGWAHREEAGELTLTSPLCPLPPTFFRNPSFLPVTFMAKEVTGMGEREAEAPLPEGQQFWGETSWVQVRFCCETPGQSLALSELQFPISNKDSWAGWLFLSLQ